MQVHSKIRFHRYPRLSLFLAAADEQFIFAARRRSGDGATVQNPTPIVSTFKIQAVTYQKSIWSRFLRNIPLMRVAETVPEAVWDLLSPG